MCFRENENCCFNKYRKPAFLAQLCCDRVFDFNLRFLRKASVENFGIPVTESWNRNLIFSAIPVRKRSKILRKLNFKKFWKKFPGNLATICRFLVEIFFEKFRKFSIRFAEKRGAKSKFRVFGITFSLGWNDQNLSPRKAHDRR